MSVPRNKGLSATTSMFIAVLLLALPARGDGGPVLNDEGLYTES